MKSDALIADLREMEIAGKKNGSQLLHDVVAAGSRRQFLLASVQVVGMIGKLPAHGNQAIDN
jgi:hypothetical protein